MVTAITTSFTIFNIVSLLNNPHIMTFSQNIQNFFYIIHKLDHYAQTSYILHILRQIFFFNPTQSHFFFDAFYRFYTPRYKFNRRMLFLFSVLFANPAQFDFQLTNRLNIRIQELFPFYFHTITLSFYLFFYKINTILIIT